MVNFRKDADVTTYLHPHSTKRTLLWRATVASLSVPPLSLVLTVLLYTTSMFSPSNPIEIMIVGLLGPLSGYFYHALDGVECLALTFAALTPALLCSSTTILCHERHATGLIILGSLVSALVWAIIGIVSHGLIIT